MVNNSTNVNKWTTIYHLNSLNTRNTTAYDIGNPGPGLGLAWLTGSQPSPL
jgi:hypothetical protein